MCALEFIRSSDMICLRMLEHLLWHMISLSPLPTHANVLSASDAVCLLAWQSQADFYLLFPLLLWTLRPQAPGFRRRLTAAAFSSCLIAIMFRILVIAYFDIGTPITVLSMGNRGKSAGHSPESKRQLELWIAWVWCAFLSRCTDLGMGVLVYLWASQPAAQQKTECSKRAFQVAFWLSLTLSAAAILASPISMAAEPDPTVPLGVRIASQVLLLSVVSPCFVSAVLLYTIMTPDAVAKLLANLLSSRKWQPFADRSYSIFLLHFTVQVLLFKFVHVLRYVGSPDSILALLILPISVYLLAFGAAALLDAAVRSLTRTICAEPSAKVTKDRSA